jgi:hypothetical protein
MRVGVQRQTLLVTTELVIWRYANAFIFTNQSELDFGIALVHIFTDYLKRTKCLPSTTTGVLRLSSLKQ